jgi:FtsH-binding integral membrane protein
VDRTALKPRESLLRQFLLGLLVLEMLGTAAELILLAHFEDPWQIAPLALIAMGLVVLTWFWFSRSANSLQALRVVMVLAIASAGIGFVLHFRANAEFQLDIDPSMKGLALWVKVLQAKAPPALAPGVMAHFGLLGLVYTYRHPALEIERRR